MERGWRVWQLKTNRPDGRGPFRQHLGWAASSVRASLGIPDFLITALFGPAYLFRGTLTKRSLSDIPLVLYRTS